MEFSKENRRMEYNNPIASRAVIDHLTQDWWQIDPKFSLIETPAERVEVHNDVYERLDSGIEFDPYDTDVVDRNYYQKDQDLLKQFDNTINGYEKPPLYSTGK